MPVVEPTTNPLAAPPPAAAAPPARPRALRVTAVIATVGVVLALLGVGLLALPVRTPGRDCGTSLTYLLDGRYDPAIDPADPPPGVSAAEARANNERPCHPRVVDRARPAALAIVGGTIVALLALGAEVLLRNQLRRRRRDVG